MKRIVFIGMFVSLAGVLLAQSGSKELRNAYNQYGMGYYDKAKQSIDKCLEFEDTKADAKTWFYRGSIYVMIEVEKTKKDSNRYKGFKNCGEIAYDSYRKAFDIDPKVEVMNMNIKTIQEGLKYVSTILVGDAYKALENKDTALMYQLANKAWRADDNNPDAIFCFAYASEIVGKMNDAKTHYLDLVKKGVKNRYPYMRLAAIYFEDEDMPNAVKTIEAGVQFFLNDSVKEKRPTRRETEDGERKKEPRDTFYVDYAETYAIIMAGAGRQNESEQTMEKALQKDTNNYNLLMSLGHEMGKRSLYDNAEIYFKKAWALKPDEWEANYYLGNCYYNNYIVRNKKAQPLDGQEYEEAVATANEILQKARPYLEKAHERDPEDINTLTMLMIVYYQNDETEKYEAVDRKIKVLKGEEVPVKKGR